MKNKVGIFLPGANGDIMTAMSVLKYKDEVWPDSDIIWYCNEEFWDLFKHGPVSEIRRWDNSFNDIMMTSDFKLDLEKKNELESTSDLTEGYFPAPWFMTMEYRTKIGSNLSDCSKHVFGVDMNKEWHPYLCFSDEDRSKVKEFIDLLPPNRRNIMLETSFNSSQSKWNGGMTQMTIDVCRARWGDCNFIFASKESDTEYFSCADFTLRQTSLICDSCDLFIGVSSGLSVATSCWGSKPVPKIQYCNDLMCSTFPIANGPIELVTRINEQQISKKANGSVTHIKNANPDREMEFKSRLKKILL